MTKGDVAKIVAILQAHDPTYPVGKIDAFVSVWEIGIGDLPYPAVESAVQDWIRESTADRRFPKPGDIRALVARNAGLFSPEEAWTVVITAVRECGARNEPRWSHPALARAVSTLGWRELCLSENIAAERTVFLRIYKAFADRAVSELSGDMLNLPAPRVISIASKGA